MAKSQDVLALARAALENNRDHAINVCKCMIANEPENSSLRERLKTMLSRVPSAMVLQDQVPNELKGLVLPHEPLLALSDMALPTAIGDELALFLEEQAHADAIRAAGLTVPHKLLLSGPPGNGKTSLAGAVAKALELPFFVLDFSSVVTSYLGETGGKIAKIFRGIAERPAVLLIDEMETVLSERAGHGSASDVGEIKRVVSTLLLEIDRLPDHVILVGATNHEEMLDRAVVRRFDFLWSLPQPDDEIVQAWLHCFAQRYPDIPILSSMPDMEIGGKSISDIERDLKKWCRRWVVEHATSKAQPAFALAS